MKNFLNFTCTLFIFGYHFTFSQVIINDPRFSEQWYLYMHEIPENQRADIRAYEAWSITTGNSNTKIAIIGSDQDIDDPGQPYANHIDLVGRITNHSATVTSDHETGVAGLIAANPNDEGIVGVNWLAPINSYSFSDMEENLDDRIIDAINDGNKIINISHGYPEPLGDANIALVTAYNNNVTTFKAMGNHLGSGISYPANSDAVIAVGASTRSNTKAGYSNTGNHIEFLAPGGDGVGAPNERNILTTSFSSNYMYTSGTSFATPLAAGGAGLLLAKRSNLYNDDIKNLLIISCDKLPEMLGADFTPQHGYGRINIKKALDFLQAPYVLNNNLTVTGGTDMGAGSQETVVLLGVPGLSDAAYVVKKHEVRKTINFLTLTDFYIWARGAASLGWKYDNEIYNQNFCEIVPGSITSTSATLRTYVYEVWTSGGISKGWYPTTPNNVVFAYTLLGIPSSITIETNTTWNGNYYLPGNVTVNPGVTLTISPNSNIYFQDGSSLTINGTLNASNATFDRGGTTNWGGIVFNSGSSGSLSNCTIQNAGWGITCNGALPTISGCTFRYYNIGIKLDNIGSSSTHISGNYFYGGGSSQGIACYYSSPYIDGGSYFHNNSMGLFCIGSSPQVSNCEFVNNVYGVYLVNSSSPTIGGYNCMIGNSTAIFAESPCNVPSSNSDVYSYGYAVRADYSAVVIAQNNYWGQYPPDPTDFYATNGANIYYLPGSVTRFTYRLPKVSSDEIVNSDWGNKSSDFSLDQTLLDASKLITDEKYDEALSFYTNYFKSNVSSANNAKKKYLMVQIAESYLRSGKDGFKDFLKEEVRNNISKNDELYAVTLELENLFFIREKNYKDAVANFAKLKDDYAEDELARKYALFNLGYIYYVLLNDKDEGMKYFGELKQEFPNDILAFNSEQLLGDNPDFNLFKQKSNETPISTNDLVDHLLISNYPNPFNPTTIISYSLPEAGNVQIKIYDVLGREVTKLVDETKSAGKHTVAWNGSNNASGIYFYTITFGNKTLYKKMLLLK